MFIAGFSAFVILIADVWWRWWVWWGSQIGLAGEWGLQKLRLRLGWGWWLCSKSDLFRCKISYLQMSRDIFSIFEVHILWEVWNLILCLKSYVKSHICKWSHGIILVHTFEVHILREVWNLIFCLKSDVKSHICKWSHGSLGIFLGYLRSIFCWKCEIWDV